MVDDRRDIIFECDIEEARKKIIDRIKKQKINIEYININRKGMEYTTKLPAEKELRGDFLMIALQDELTIVLDKKESLLDFIFFSLYTTIQYNEFLIELDEWVNLIKPTKIYNHPEPISLKQVREKSDINLIFCKLKYPILDEKNNDLDSRLNLKYIIGGKNRLSALYCNIDFNMSGEELKEFTKKFETMYEKETKLGFEIVIKIENKLIFLDYWPSNKHLTIGYLLNKEDQYKHINIILELVDELVIKNNLKEVRDVTNYQIYSQEEFKGPVNKLTFHDYKLDKERTIEYKPGEVNRVE